METKDWKYWSQHIGEKVRIKEYPGVWSMDAYYPGNLFYPIEGIIDSSTQDAIFVNINNKKYGFGVDYTDIELLEEEKFAFDVGDRVQVLSPGRGEGTVVGIIEKDLRGTIYAVKHDIWIHGHDCFHYKYIKGSNIELIDKTNGYFYRADELTKISFKNATEITPQNTIDLKFQVGDTIRHPERGIATIKKIERFDKHCVLKIFQWSNLSPVKSPYSQLIDSRSDVYKESEKVEDKNMAHKRVPDFPTKKSIESTATEDYLKYVSDAYRYLAHTTPGHLNIANLEDVNIGAPSKIITPVMLSGKVDPPSKIKTSKLVDDQEENDYLVHSKIFKTKIKKSSII